MNYLEKLKDPRWQKKRLEVLEKSNFACDNCEDDKSTLHVHHHYYIKGNEPWEYDLFELGCLCDKCHSIQHSNLSELELFLLSCVLNRDSDDPKTDKIRFRNTILNFIKTRNNA